ncbi:hypothetical protein GUJ93_ZPchr0006g40977 [Zizania palustris]|uniref:Uncharacterized protein n=1 Tax=Zizania palustris TaxID=103762 RepID=A0A8J5VKF9_ZIZPA|nr:hypothetical protein GUJ93_ZPchr0006g40977 [Zizania palustris]
MIRRWACLKLEKERLPSMANNSKAKPFTVQVITDQKAAPQQQQEPSASCPSSEQVSSEQEQAPNRTI